VVKGMVQKRTYIEQKKFTLNEIESGIIKFRRRIDDLNNLVKDKTVYDDAQVNNVESYIIDTIRDVFGNNSPEFNDHAYFEIWKGNHNLGDNKYERQKKYELGIPYSKTIIEGFIKRLDEKRLDIVGSPPFSEAKEIVITATRKVFIVHGHDEEVKLKVARFLDKLELEPVILSEYPNEGKTIIEKFEHHADVAYAIVLLTPDDIGYKKGMQDYPKPRARQNVLLELGYFIGRLDRSHVCALYKGDVEIPSDYHGVLYESLDEGDGWQLKLAKEMKAVGIHINLNLIL
jgi:predicted nucleotide-binding protein